MFLVSWDLFVILYLCISLFSLDNTSPTLIFLNKLSLSLPLSLINCSSFGLVRFFCGVGWDKSKWINFKALQNLFDRLQ